MDDDLHLILKVTNKATVTKCANGYVVSVKDYAGNEKPGWIAATPDQLRDIFVEALQDKPYTEPAVG